MSIFQFANRTDSTVSVDAEVRGMAQQRSVRIWGSNGRTVASRVSGFQFYHAVLVRNELTFPFPSEYGKFSHTSSTHIGKM